MLHQFCVKQMFLFYFIVLGLGLEPPEVGGAYPDISLTVKRDINDFDIRVQHIEDISNIPTSRLNLIQQLLDQNRRKLMEINLCNANLGTNLSATKNK